MNRKTAAGGIVVIAVFVCLLLLYTVPAFRQDAELVTSTAVARLGLHSHTPFPEVDAASLTPLQRKILAIARDEYARHPVSFDATVLKYSQGEKQAWCANFISWTMKQAGAPYTNPHSKGWRIPGVFTLQEYYQSQHRYVKAGSYKPQPGDVAFYVHKSTFAPLATEHVALVVQSGGGTMTTLGGNEAGKMQINTRSIAPGTHDLTGFGKLK